MKAIITVGISASGKTTWAEKWCSENERWINICRDNIRWALMRQKGLDPCWAHWNWKWEDEVTDLRDVVIEFAADWEQNIIISDTNIKPIYREKLINFLEGLGYDVEMKVFRCSLEEAIERDKGRQHPVGARTITLQYHNLSKQELYRE